MNTRPAGACAGLPRNHAWQAKLEALRAASADWNAVWKEFPRQEPALAFAAQSLKPARLFSYEVEGARLGPLPPHPTHPIAVAAVVAAASNRGPCADL
jgi:hypothetical protein